MLLSSYKESFRDLLELRNAVETFIEQYNTQWRFEKNGYLSPREARKAYQGKEAA